MVFHVSTAEGVEVVRKARLDGVKIFAETCPHYLLLTAEDVNKPGLDGAKWMCSPSLRTESGSNSALAGAGAGRPAGDFVRSTRLTDLMRVES